MASRREFFLWASLKVVGIGLSGDIVRRGITELWEDIPAQAARVADLKALEREVENETGMPSEDEIITARRALNLPVPDPLIIFIRQVSESVSIKTQGDPYLDYDSGVCVNQDRVDVLKGNACHVLETARSRAVRFKEVSENFDLARKQREVSFFGLNKLPPIFLGTAALFAAFGIKTNIRSSEI